MNLSDYFSAVATKRLSAHEVDPTVSNGHEFQGVNRLRDLFGAPTAKETFAATFLWMDDTEDGSHSIDGDVTWYDSRAGKPRAAEYRLYYPAIANDIVHRAKPGDFMLVGRLRGGKILVAICPRGSTTQRQLEWLFGLPGDDEFAVQSGENLADIEAGIAARIILDALGIEKETVAGDWLDRAIGTFGTRFPDTITLASFARSTLQGADPVREPDLAIAAATEREYDIFKAIEKHLLHDKLREGFTSGNDVDVEAFLTLSQSVNQRRKSRAGKSFEHHLSWLFTENGLRFSHNTPIENGKRPDFLFPGASEYSDPQYPVSAITLLGAKSTCRDRWRQVLAEGDRIATKHLATLEPGISPGQTSEMQASLLQLVVPRPLHATYTQAQSAWLMDLGDFIAMVREQQRTTP